jgi:hypothetical protein
VCNILTPVQARKAPPFTNINAQDSEIKTVKVTDMTNAPIQVKSIGSLFSSINKSVSSALNSFMSLQSHQNAPDEGHNHPRPQITPNTASFMTMNPNNSAPPVYNVHNNTPSFSSNTVTKQPVYPVPSEKKVKQPPGYAMDHKEHPHPRGREERRGDPGGVHSTRTSRSNSPRRDIGFSAAVTNLVEQAHEIIERDRRTNAFCKKCK